MKMSASMVAEYLSYARIAIETGNTARAKELLDSVLRVDPASLVAKLGRAEVKHMEGQTADAVAEAVNIAVNHPLDTELLAACAELLRRCDSHDLATSVDGIGRDAKIAAQILQATLGSVLTMADFGSSNESVVRAPNEIAKLIHFISLDAVSVGSCNNNFGKYTPITGVIGDKAGIADFYELHFVQGSSMLKVKDSILDDFGLRSLSTVKEIHRVETKRLTDILTENEVSKLDYLKTDLEGMDGPVIKDSEEFLSGTAVIQAELRFLPCYDGEPYFDEIASHMRHQNFELLHITTENWRYATEHRDYAGRGRSVWADVVFVKNIEAYFKVNGRTPDSLVRYCLMCGLSGNINYAEYILSKYKNLISRDVREALLHYLVPQTRFGTPAFSRPQFGHVAFQ